MSLIPIHELRRLHGWDLSFAKNQKFVQLVNFDDKKIFENLITVGSRKTPNTFSSNS